MNHYLITTALTLALAAGWLYPTDVRADESIPVADFFKRAEFSGNPTLSPDGENLAVLTPRNGRFVLAVINLQTRVSTVVASDADWDVANPQQVSNQRLVFSISKGGSEVLAKQINGGLFAVNRDGSAFRKLVASVKDAIGTGLPCKHAVMLATGVDNVGKLYLFDTRKKRWSPCTA